MDDGIIIVWIKTVEMMMARADQFIIIIMSRHNFCLFADDMNGNNRKGERKQTKKQWL